MLSGAASISFASALLPQDTVFLTALVSTMSERPSLSGNRASKSCILLCAAARRPVMERANKLALYTALFLQEFAAACVSTDLRILNCRAV